MSWTCEKCATQHKTREEIESCEREQRKIVRWTIAILVAICLTILIVELVWNQYAYGDWKCAFMHCRKVVL